MFTISHNINVRVFIQCFHFINYIAVVIERRVIEYYFHLGYKYELITELLKNEHGIEMTGLHFKETFE